MCGVWLSSPRSRKCLHNTTLHRTVFRIEPVGIVVFQILAFGIVTVIAVIAIVEVIAIVLILVVVVIDVSVTDGGVINHSCAGLVVSGG